MGSSAKTETTTNQISEVTTITDSYNTYDVTSVGDVGNVSVLTGQMNMGVVLASLGVVAVVVFGMFFKR